MQTNTFKSLALTTIASSAFLLSACGSNSSPSNSVNDGKSNVVEGPLDVLQDQVVTGVVGLQVGAALPQPLGPTVECAADAVNSLIDAPDALLAALANAAGGDPAAAFQGATDQIVGSLQRFAADLQSTLMALTGSTTCSTVAGGGSSGEPMAGNPLAGTPLEPIGAALETIVVTLSGSGTGEDPNLTSLTDLLAPQLLLLSSAFNIVPDQIKETPVFGGLLLTLRDATGDLAIALPAIGNYDAATTNYRLQLLLDNLLSHVLLDVLPVRMIDAQTGGDFAGQIENGVDQLVAALGVGTGQLITPLFDQLLNGAASPILNPIENLLDQLLGRVVLGGVDPATGNPLTALLAGIVGDGTSNPLDGLLALLTFGSDDSTLGALTTILGGDSETSPLNQLGDLTGDLPVDDLLAQLQDATAGIPILGGVLDTLLGLLGGLLGGNQG